MGLISNKSITKNKTTKKPILKNYINWFEIPANNFNQALKFYNYIYDINMETFENDNHTMAFFPAKGGIGGAIVSGLGSTPSQTGSLLYLNGGDDLNNILNRVTEAGGRVILPKTLINKESGYFAIFIDIEGNKIAFHSQK